MSAKPASASKRFGLIFANGELNDGPAVRSALAKFLDSPATLIIAADGGARHAQALGLAPHLVVGDFDSLTEAELDGLRVAGAELRHFSAHKDESDLELAILAAIDANCDSICVIGGIGDRLDQTLANVYLLVLPALCGRDVWLVAGKQTVWMAYPGETQIPGLPGDTLSLIPLNGEVSGIVTDGLEYPLRNETLTYGPARGISNVLLRESASIRFERGVLLLIQTIGRA
ncbi:MAG: thiamine diphosphokinase [Aggregatilineales bacterium]